VMRDVAERFTEELVRGAQALHVGDPMDWRTEIGPMVSREQHDLVAELVDDAVAAGATLRCGGPTAPPAIGAAPRASGDPAAAASAGFGHWYAPAVLTDVTHDMRIMREEIFGPVIPVIAVESEDEAIELANDSEFGLGASVWTSDRARGDRIARRIESGMVWINDHMYSHGTCSCAWGGVKDSGVGRSHSKFGFYECVNVKQLSWEPGLTRNFWWHPYDRSLGRAMHEAATLLYGRDSDKAAALRRGARSFAKLGAKTLKRG
jgi:acyl-CoA reductase-like NAD-dependent aldehyde dehydrogenase